MNDYWTTNKTKLEALAKSIDKSAKIYTKDNWFCYSVAWLLFVISFGFFKREKFLEGFATTIGHMVFIPKEWSYEACEWTLVHECRHIKQFRVMGLFIHPMAGLPIAMVVYLFLLFPVYLAIGRVLLEYDADVFEYKYMIKEKGVSASTLVAVVVSRAITLSGVGYLFPAPKFLINFLYIRLMNKLTKEYYGWM